MKAENAWDVQIFQIFHACIIRYYLLIFFCGESLKTWDAKISYIILHSILILSYLLPLGIYTQLEGFLLGIIFNFTKWMLFVAFAVICIYYT